MVRLKLKFEKPEHPVQRVSVMMTTAEAVCRSVGAGPDDAVMALMTAAARIVLVHSEEHREERILAAMEDALRNAIVAAKEFFPANGEVRH